MLQGHVTVMLKCFSLGTSSPFLEKVQDPRTPSRGKGLVHTGIAMDDSAPR